MMMMDKEKDDDGEKEDNGNPPMTTGRWLMRVTSCRCIMII